MLFVAGLGRSGSTLIDRAMGGADGCVSLGEIVRLWQRGVVENAMCGCGETFRNCEFWGPVGEAAFGGWDTLGHRPRDLQAAVDRTRYIPLMLTGWGRRYQRRRAEYARLLARLYTAIRDVAGADLIVDSSKDLSTTFLLRTVPEIDVRVIHLVRDSRAVAYSWTKYVQKGGSGGSMDRYSPAIVGLRYTFSNLVLEAARWLGLPMLRQRYEDFVAEPAAATERLLRFGGMSDPTLTHVDGRMLRAAPHHSVGGNPMRFALGTIEIRLDRQWQDALPTRDRRIVSAMTSPMLLLYRYPIRHRTQ
jgi:hypothetical protein